MGYFPTRVHRVLAVLCFAGMVLLVLAMSVDARAIAIAASLLFLGSASALSIADVRYLLTTRRGYGRVSGHITEEKNPVSFKLHVVLAGILAVFWAIGLMLGVQELTR